MGKFEVCIKGRNFLVKTGRTVKKNAFRSTWFVEAKDMSDAVEKAMASLRAELKNTVLNDESDPPAVDLEDVSEVYYFKEDLELEDTGIAGKKIDWDEKVEEFAKPVGALKKKWLVTLNRIGERDLHLHAISIHFTSALYPVAILCLFLFLIFGNASFLHTYSIIMLLATLSAPLSYLTGVLEWRQKYEGVKIPIFTTKIRYGIVLFALGAAATLWYFASPGVLAGGGALSAAFILLNVSILPVVIYLAYIGGVILYEGID